jgi:hypothetical protein
MEALHALVGLQIRADPPRRSIPSPIRATIAVMARSRVLSLVALALAGICAVGCGDTTKKFTTTLQVVQIERFGKDPASAAVVDLELRYVDCPGECRRVIRTNGAFSKCAANLKEGDRLKAEIVSKWTSDRNTARNEIVKLGDCKVDQDPKEEANYEMVQVCSEIKTSGQIVGVRCDRSRPKSLTDKCPWFKRR